MGIFSLLLLLPPGPVSAACGVLLPKMKLAICNAGKKASCVTAAVALTTEAVEKVVLPRSPTGLVQGFGP